MHIPDSALSPGTTALFGLAMGPIWLAAGRRLRATLASRRVPLIALGAAYSFTLMMFNLPVPGATTVHATGAVLLAIVLGPWAALLALTVTLVIQALLFADGGVLALGVNCFTMAFVMPCAGWAVYRLVAARSAPGSARRAFAAGLGAWTGLNLAALVAALALGLQPLLFRDGGGRPLYFPFGPGVTLPAVMIPHLLIGGVAEAFFTVFSLRAVRAAGIPFAGDAPGARGRAPSLAWLLAAFGAMIALVPLGLLTTGTAWGEWSPAELARRAGGAPHAPPLPPLPGLSPGSSAGRGGFSFVLAAAFGEVMIAALAIVIGQMIAKAKRRRAAPAPRHEPGMLPAWMRARDPHPAVAPSRRRLARSDFAMRTLADLARGAQELLARERIARSPGLLQRIDPRAKLVALLGFVVLACLQRSLGPALALLALATVLGARSGAPPRLLLGRVGLTVGLFVGLVTLPAALDVVTPGAPLVVLRHEPHLAVSVPGAARVVFLVVRAAAAASFGALLALTTRWSDLLAALRALRAPRLFVEVLGMAWRYFALLLESAREMFVARRSRTVGRAPASARRRFLGGTAAALWGRTLALSEEVHLAMIARGGDARVAAADSGTAPLAVLDRAWLAAMAALGVAIALWGRLA